MQMKLRLLKLVGGFYGKSRDTSGVHLRQIPSWLKPDEARGVSGDNHTFVPSQSLLTVRSYQCVYMRPMPSAT